jgi:trigger factor
MQISQTLSEGLKREFTITLAAKDFDQSVIERLTILGQKAKLPGFRPGKAPQHVLKQRFGAQATEEALEKVINSGVQKLLKEHNLRQATRPKIDVVSFGDGKDVEYKVALEILPEIEVKTFSDIKLEKLIVTLADKEVEEKLEELAKDRKKFKDLEKARAAKKGDLLHLDLEVVIDGKVRKDFSKHIHVELGTSERLIFEQLESKLEGVKVGEKLELEDTIISEIDDPALAGKKATLKITITNIQELQKFKVDEELAKEMGVETLDELRQQVQKSLQTEYDNLSRLRLKRHLLDALAEKYEFELPATMVENEFNAIWKRLQDELKAAEESGQPNDADGKSETELQTEYRQISERRVRLGLLISEIARLNKIQTTEEEIRRAIFSEAMRYPRHMQQVIDFYRKNPAAVEQLAAPILEDKVVDFILAGVSLKERTVEVPQLLKEIKGVVPGFEDEEEASESNAKTKTSKEKTSKAKGKAA